MKRRKLGFSAHAFFRVVAADSRLSGKTPRLTPPPNPLPSRGGGVEIYPTEFSPCDHARVSMWEAMVHQAKAIETRFERDAVRSGDSKRRCFGEKKGSRRSV